MKDLTIITVCYNSEQTIERCINSVQKQLNSYVEYLIVDGNSKDNTLDIIKRYADTDENIRYISENDSGIYDAMNKGINLANGKWIYFVNSDDCIKEDVMQKVIKVIRQDKYDCIYGNIEEILEYEKNLYFREIKANKKLCELKKGMVVPHPGFFCKTDVIRELGGFDTRFKIAGDWDLVLRMYVNGYKFYYIDEIISEFYLGGACSASHNIERHAVRKKNNTYKLMDTYLIKDVFNSYKATIAKLILGSYKERKRLRYYKLK